jgi:hypothetical protein
MSKPTPENILHEEKSLKRSLPNNMNLSDYNCTKKRKMISTPSGPERKTTDLAQIDKEIHQKNKNSITLQIVQQIQQTEVL